MRILTCVGVLGLCAACGSSDQKPTLSTLSPAGDACPSGGGVVTSSGVDDDEDGVLDESEIDERVTLCAADTLTRLDAIAPGEICPNGGTSIKAGTDDDRDGLLDDAEIDTTRTLCKGTLTRTTSIAPDEAACFGVGGVKLELGADDDGDDFLDPEEIDLTTITCNQPSPRARPASPPAAYQILMDGGDANGGFGGQAGFLDLDVAASGGGTAALFDTGVTDASFTMPSHTPVLGATPLSVDANLTILPWPGSPPAENTPYAHEGQVRLAKGATDPFQDPLVTSITIAAGVTLTIQATDVDLSGDLVNHGTLRPNVAANGLSIYVRNYVGGPGSTIDTKGTAAGEGAGGIYLSARDSVYNQGTIDTTGVAGGQGGGGGTVHIDAARSLYNTGDLIARGGESTGALSTGAGAGAILLYANGGVLYNAGDLTTTGGPGTQLSGTSRQIYLQATPGPVRQSGVLDASGTAPNNCAANCLGGDAGGIEIYAYGGPIFNSGDLRSRGASVTAANGCGGNATDIYISAESNDIYMPGQGTVHLSGTVDLRGGDGGSGAGTVCTNSAHNGGGRGGQLDVEGNAQLPVGQEVVFFGYDKLSAVGGTSGGGFAGGQGGAAQIDRFRDENEAAGPIVSWIDIDVSGGGATGGDGGSAGTIAISTSRADDPDGSRGLDVVENHGDLTADGGEGANGGGPSQTSAIILYGPDGVWNTGDLRVRGGRGLVTLGGDAGGGDGPASIILSSDLGPVTNSGALVTDGGDGATSGGTAGHICLEGGQVTSSGSLQSQGGNAGAASTNGNGGDSWLKSFLGTTSHTGSFDAIAGTGGVGGLAGELVLDRLDGRCFNGNQGD